MWLRLRLTDQSQPSRERSAGLLAERIAARRVLTEPAIVTGDFNVGETNPAIMRLTAPQNGAAALFIDTFRARHPDEKTAGTFTGNAFPATPGMIDLVNQAKGYGYAIFFLTGRGDSQHQATIANLISDTAAGLPDLTTVTISGKTVPEIDAGYQAPRLVCALAE